MPEKTNPMNETDMWNWIFSDIPPYFNWWEGFKTTGTKGPDGWEAGWSVEVTAVDPEYPEEPKVVKTITAKEIRGACRKIMSARRKEDPEAFLYHKELREACADMLFDGDGYGGDVGTGDAILQVAVLGEERYR